MRVHSVLNRFFNATPTADQPTTSEAIEIDEPDQSILPSLQNALSEAAEKFARTKIAAIYKIDGTRWNLTGLQVFVRANGSQQLMELKRVPPRVLRRIAMHAVRNCERYSAMYEVDEKSFFGLTVEPADDALQDDLVNVLGIYGKSDTVAYSFAFLGDYTDEAPEQAPNSEANDGCPSSEHPENAPSKQDAQTSSTPLVGGEHIVLEGGCLQIGGPGLEEVIACTDSVCNQWPLVLGRAQSGYGGQILAKPQGMTEHWQPLFGSVYISTRHLRLDKNERGQLCVTDTSSNGTWLDGQRLPKDQAVPLPSTGTLSLVCDPQQSNPLASSVSLRFKHTCVPATTPASPPAQTEHAAAAAPANHWPFAQTPPETKHPNPLSHATNPHAERQEPVLFDAPAWAQHGGTDIDEPTTTGLAQDGSTDLGDGQGTDIDHDIDPALAWLRVRTADGQEHLHPIHEFPCLIGREALGDIPAQCGKVSRQHLRIEGMHGQHALQVSNLAHQRNGTFNAGRRETERFVLPLHNPHNPDQSLGWLTLGSPRLLPNTVQIRLERAQ